jgi:hypothetical protein
MFLQHNIKMERLTRAMEYLLNMGADKDAKDNVSSQTKFTT